VLHHHQRLRAGGPEAAVRHAPRDRVKVLDVVDFSGGVGEDGAACANLLPRDAGEGDRAVKVTQQRLAIAGGCLEERV